jgi:hypothetical protein
MRENTPRGTVFEMEFPARPPVKEKPGSAAPWIDDAGRES